MSDSFSVKLGRVVSTPKGFAVVRLEAEPKLFRQGATVVTGTGDRVGLASDIIGNVTSPYAVVKLYRNLSVKEGEELYMIVPARRGRRHHHGRRW